MNRGLVAALLPFALFSGGCSWLNAPERNLTPPGTGGDGIELFCDDMLDDDNDLEFDCDDTDCAQEPACCELRRTTLSEDWTAANLSNDWLFTPTGGGAWGPLRPSMDGATFVGGFLPDDSPRGLLSKDCVSLGLGGWVNATLRTTSATGCAPDSECERYGGLVLTVASDAAVGGKLQDELAVTLHAGGLVLVTQADVEVARTTVGVDATIGVEIELRPKLDDENLPILTARVTVDGSPILEDFTVVAISNLLSEGDCAEIPGLRVAAQGRGDGVYVGPLETAKQDCANPSQFDEQSAILTGSSLEFNPSWVSAYVGSPVSLYCATIEVDASVGVEIELRPRLDDENLPILTARVTVDGSPLLEDFTVVAISDLLSEGDCSEVPGLRVAAQGRGDGVYVGPVVTTKQDCANPSQFDEQSAILTGSSLEFNPSWVSAYVGSPALASSRNSISDVQWDLMLEASNDPPELEPTTHIGYALGHARVATDEGADWPLSGWTISDSPKAGDDPPSCLDGSCSDNRSVREPHLLAELNEDGELRDLVLSFARELVSDPSKRDLFGIQLVRPLGSPGTSLTLPGTATLSPAQIPECVSLRDPSLIPVDPEAQEGYWLLFTCVDGAGPAMEIHAVRISRALEVVREGGGPMRRVVLVASELGPFAAAGIRSPEPLISFEKDGMRLRIWFLAQRAPGEWGVALAEARTHDTAVLAFELPEPVPFLVNPIISSTSSVVRSGCLGEDCTITGFAVAPRADDPDRLRFVLARRLYLPEGDPTDQLIPLEQTWSKP